jgi:hypothetical protein
VAVALLALARSGAAAEQPLLHDRLAAWRWDADDPETALIALRALQVSLARHGRPEPARSAALHRKVAELFPTPWLPVNQFAGELLAYFDDSTLVAKTMPLLAAAPNQEEALTWLMLLRNVRVGWSAETRQAYWRALQAGDRFVGGRELPVALYSIAAEFRDGLPPAERAAFAAAAGEADALGPLAPARTKVREWRADDLVASGTRRPDLRRGHEVFAQALCLRCHRFDGRGKPIGPDLDAVGHRMGRRDLLDAILTPSKAIDPKYAQHTVELRDGRAVTGRVVGGDDSEIMLAPDPVAPWSTVRIRLAEVERQFVLKVSPMPAHLLDGFTAEEIHDLLAYLESR